MKYNENGDHMKKYLKGITLLVLVGFMALYFAYSNGYYELRQSEKVSLTNEMIEQFEKDIIDGKDVSLNDYITEENYSNKTNNTALKVSEKLESIIDHGIKFIFKKIGNVVE